MRVAFSQTLRVRARFGRVECIPHAIINETSLVSRAESAHWLTTTLTAENVSLQTARGVAASDGMGFPAMLRPV